MVEGPVGQLAECRAFARHCQLTYRTSEFRVVELKTPRFSTAIGSNLYAEDSVEYFSVYYYYYYYFKPTSTKPQEEKLR